MSPEATRERSLTAAGPRHIQHDLLLAALPHPVLALAEGERIVYANPAAEQFFSAGQATLKRHRFADLVAFGCPLVNLVEKVRRTGASVNE